VSEPIVSSQSSFAKLSANTTDGFSSVCGVQVAISVAQHEKLAGTGLTTLDGALPNRGYKYRLFHFLRCFPRLGRDLPCSCSEELGLTSSMARDNRFSRVR